MCRFLPHLRSQSPWWHFATQFYLARTDGCVYTLITALMTVCDRDRWRSFTPPPHPLARSVSVPRGAPLNFAAEQSGSQSASLSWNPPAKSLRYGDVVMYEIHFHRLRQAVDVFQVNATGTTQIIDSLEINQDYIFQIRAYTSKGAGPWSNRLPLKITGQRKRLD